jgi:hypothetical protein
MVKLLWILALVSIVALAVIDVILINYNDSTNSVRAEEAQAPLGVNQNRKIPAALEQVEGEDMIAITGGMTLADIESTTGVPAKEIATSLHIPTDMAKDETLGRLRQSHPFTMNQVRKIVAELMDMKHLDNPSAGVDQVAGREEQAASLEGEKRMGREREAEGEYCVLITGSMTLREIEARTGLSARVIAEKLRLPRQASLDMPLGKLATTYRFTMQDVRSIVSDLLKESNL